MIVTGLGDREGIGLRVECPLFVGGSLRLVHWFVSPLRAAPDGIVEDFPAIEQIERGPMPPDFLRLSFSTLPLPEDRAARRNLASLDGSCVLGLRCWDIPHDRHAVLTRLDDGTGELAPATLARMWRAIDCIGTL